MARLLLSRFTGVRLSIRLIEPIDAEYVYDLRCDPTYNQHLSKVRGTVEDQRRWIASYKAREATGREFYFVIERLDRTRCGLVRLYGIEADRFTWGSWILDTAKPPKAALDSAILIYTFGFEHLGCARATFDVRSSNTHTLAFHRRFGAREVGVDAQNTYFTYSRTRFEADYPAFKTVLEQERRP